MRFRLSLTLVALAFASTAAWAVTQHEAPSGVEVDRRGEITEMARVREVSPLIRNEAWGDFLRRSPGWVARWDATQGGPSRLEGPPTAIPGWSGARLDAAHAADAAIAALRQASSWIPVDELEHVRTIEDRSGFWVHFSQKHDGVPVWASRVSLRMTFDGRVAAITNRAYPGLELSVLPSASRGRAESESSFGLPAGSKQRGDATLYILPIRHATGPEFRLVWKSEWRNDTTHGRWDTFVDAMDGSLLWRYDASHYADVSGRVTSSVELQSPDGAFVTRGLPYATIEVVDPDSVPFPTATDVDGNYAATSVATTGRSLRGTMAGGFGITLNEAQGGATTVHTIPLADGNPVTADFDWGTSSSDPAARDTYYHAMVAHDYIQVVDPSFHLLDYQMPLRVNIDDACNAFWDGEGLNFFRAAGGCANIGRIADVVYHEYGHGITDFQYRPFFPNSAMHEGFSDYYAASITGQPVIGIGFLGPGTSLRRVDVDHVWPDDISNDPHETGLIVAGALWDLREMVGTTRADSLFHFARYGYSDNFDDYFADLLLYDSGDNNIYDGTPNFGAVTGSFRHHGIGDYSIHVSHLPVKDSEGTAQEFGLTASFLSIFPLADGSAHAHVTIDVGENSETFDYPMTATGGIREYTHNLAAQPNGAVVRYYFTATDTTGATVTLPEGGVDDPFVFRVGPDTTAPTIAHEPLLDLPADSPNVRVRAEVEDNLDQDLAEVHVVWRRNGANEQTTPMSLLRGNTFEGLLSLTGSALGDAIDYRIEAIDGAAVPNTALSPESGFNTFVLVRGSFADFESSNGGLIPAGEWQWGAPSFPVTPYSGEKVWGTVLDGNYSNGTTSILELPPLDLTAFSHAGLTFQHSMLSEPHYDGGVVEVTTDGVAWNVLYPDGDYDDPSLDATQRPGFTGGDGTWRMAEFDLGTYVGTAGARVRLRFASDVGVTGPGWYIDDLQVVDRQIYLRPLGLAAANADGEGVLLTWNSPDNPLAKRNAPLSGYNLYRADDASETPARLNTTPITATRYVDATAVSGQTYAYWATTVYPDGESRLAGPVFGSTFQPTFSIEIAAMTASVDSIGAEVDTSAVVANHGTGQLEANVYLGAENQTIDDLRYSVDLTQSDEEWHLLASDGDSTGGPDLLSIETKQTLGSIRFRFTTRDVLPDLSTFNFIATFDTDRNRENGPEFSLYAGAIPLGFGVPAILVDADMNPFFGEPFDADFQSGQTTAEFEFSKAALGEPRKMHFRLGFYNDDQTELYDRMPNPSPIEWVSPLVDHLSISSETPVNLGLLFKSSDLAYGTYHARLFFETNDPQHEIVAVPLTFNVVRPTAVLLEAWDASAGAEGVVLRWRTGGDEPAGFFVYRREVSPSLLDEVKLTDALFNTKVDGLYRFVDLTAEAEREYEYRLVGIEPNGEESALGSYRVSTTGLVPAELWLSRAMPNPARDESTIRFGLPTSGAVTLKVFSADGRLVRTLLAGTPLKAGYHSARWDGRDDGQRRTAAGLYFFRLERGGKMKTEKLLRLR